MITAKLIGRLGNSMFQIAACIGYARKYDQQWLVQEEVLNGESSIHRVYPNLPKTHRRARTYNEHPDGICPTHGDHYNLCRFNYHPIPYVREDLYLVGFWQSWRYFEGQDAEIKSVFALPHVAGYEDYVSIHVRRGDYVQFAGSFPPITVEYIQQALNKINTGKAIVFSDDIGWCRANLHHLETSQMKIEYSEGNEHQDLSLMASCGHHIIANSTFSWWGAYLGHNPDRIVVTPSAKPGSWFGPAGIKTECGDLLPPEWIQIER